MKKYLLALVLSFVALTATYAQYYDNDPVGTVYHYEMSNKLMGKLPSTYTLTNVAGNVLTFEVKTQVPGMSEPMKLVNTLTFADGKITQDPQNIAAQTKASMAQSMGGADMDVDIKGDIAYTPLVGKVGDKLPLTTTVVTVKVQGMDVVTTAELVRNEITAEEEVTTPVGTFKTLKLEQEIKTTTEVMGQKQNISQTGTYWIVPNKGVVKSETTTMGQTMTNELVKITKP